MRVRSVQARVDEYRRQLQRLGGKVPSTGATATEDIEHGQQGQDPYPSIRQLPVLGVAWSDLYRRSKVQETVFETLTKQYELAKVEEARETPSVKVLDPADIPEKKSFPPRTILVALCTGFAFVLGIVWVLAHARWQEIGADDPAKALSEQIFQNISTTIFGLSARVRQSLGARAKHDSGERD